MWRALSIFLSFLLPLGAALHELDSFHSLRPYLHPRTLLILDVDDTLLNTPRMLGCDEWFLHRMTHHGLEEALNAWEAVRRLTQMAIVEEGTPELIGALQQEGYAIMALTTQGLGMVRCTTSQLLHHQFDLSKTAPHVDDLYFIQERLGILYRRGILFTSGTHKGKALFRLLDLMGYMPGEICFVNDKMSHLKEVEATAQEHGIAFVGLRYSYSDARKAAFRPEIAEIEFAQSTLGHLLSDEEAVGSLGN